MLAKAPIDLNWLLCMLEKLQLLLYVVCMYVCIASNNLNLYFVVSNFLILYCAISRMLTAVTPLHPFQFGLHPVPVTFNVLSVNTYHWILEVKGVIHHLVSAHIGQRPNIVVCPPLITPDLSVGFCMLLHKW